MVLWMLGLPFEPEPWLQDEGQHKNYITSELVNDVEGN